MNISTISGRLTREPYIIMSKTGILIARFTLAVDRPKRKTENGGQRNDSDFIPCVAFGKRAEFVQNYLHCGMKVEVSGHLQSGKYTNKKGEPVYTLELAATAIEFAETKQVNETYARKAAQQASAQNTASPIRSNQQPSQNASDPYGYDYANEYDYSSYPETDAMADYYSSYPEASMQDGFESYQTDMPLPFENIPAQNTTVQPNRNNTTSAFQSSDSKFMQSNPGRNTSMNERFADIPPSTDDLPFPS